MPSDRVVKILASKGLVPAPVYAPKPKKVEEKVEAPAAAKTEAPAAAKAAAPAEASPEAPAAAEAEAPAEA